MHNHSRNVKAPSCSRWLRVILGVCLFWSADALRPRCDEAIRYVLLGDSELIVTPPGDAPPRHYPLRGGFWLRPQLAPLDWDCFLVERLQADDARAWPTSDAPILLGGEGSYSRGGRLDPNEQMRLNAHAEGYSLPLDSGAVPVGNAWPRVEIQLTGSVTEEAGQTEVEVRLVAIPELQRWHYELIEGSYLSDECLPCGRPSLRWPARGGFDLVLVATNPIESRYQIADLALSAEAGEGMIAVTGSGQYTQGGEVALIQTCQLEVWVNLPSGLRTATLRTSSVAVDRPWPMLSADTWQTDGTLTSTLNLQIQAAPFREFWFVPEHGMTPGTDHGPWGPLPSHISNGDLLADDGRVVKSNDELVSAFGLEPAERPVPIDALDVLPGGELWLSPGTSESASKVSDGNLYSLKNGLVKTYAQWLGPFGLQPPIPDLGLDAVQVLENGEVLFSIREDGFSERLGRWLGHGDILSASGAVWRSHQEIVAALKPSDPSTDHGLDALYVWTSGEIWFSVRDRFESAALGSIGSGDLLSDRGYIVRRNLELIRPFSPLEDLADFGLHGLVVLTDVTAPGSRPSLAVRRTETGGVELTWKGSGRFSQLQGADELSSRFVPCHPIQLETSWSLSPGTEPGTRFYQLHQW